MGQHAALLRIAGAQRRYLSDALQRIAGLEARRIGAVQEAIATFLANYQCASPLPSDAAPMSTQKLSAMHQRPRPSVQCVRKALTNLQSDA